MPSYDDVGRWIASYVKAWNSNDPEDIRALFTTDAVYSTEPYKRPWTGADAIVAGWLEHADEPGETTFTWEPHTITGDTAFVTGTTTYPGTAYSNLWIIQLDSHGRCSSFAEWWMEHPRD